MSRRQPGGPMPRQVPARAVSGRGAVAGAGGRRAVAGDGIRLSVPRAAGLLSRRDRGRLVGMLLLVSIGVQLLYTLLRRISPPSWALFAVLATWVGTNLRCYAAVTPLMPHGLAFLLVVGMVAVAADTPAAPRPNRRLFALGVLTGLLFLTRPQQVLLALFLETREGPGRTPAAGHGSSSCAVCRLHGRRSGRPSPHHHALGAQAARPPPPGRAGGDRARDRGRAPGADRLQLAGLALRGGDRRGEARRPGRALPARVPGLREPAGAGAPPAPARGSARQAAAAHPRLRDLPGRAPARGAGARDPVRRGPGGERGTAGAGLGLRLDPARRLVVHAGAPRARGGLGVDHAPHHVRAGGGGPPRHPADRDPGGAAGGGALHRRRVQAGEAPARARPDALERVGSAPLRGPARSVSRAGAARPGGEQAVQGALPKRCCSPTTLSTCRRKPAPTRSSA